MNSKSGFTNTIAFQLFISLILILILVFSVFVYLNIKFIEERSFELAKESSVRISDIIRRSTRYGMLIKRNEDVHQIINTIGKQPNLVGVKIYNKQGVIMFSAKNDEILTKADFNSPACSPCHESSSLRVNISENERIRVFNNIDGSRVLGLITPINNESDCYSASCHAHPESAEILGVIDVHFSLRSVDAIIASEKKHLLIFSVIVILIISIFSGVFIWVMVRNPVKKLFLGTIELGKGNLNYKIEYKGKNEFRNLAESFNIMTEKLSQAYSEIEEWNEKLNIKVEEKTKQLKEIYNQLIHIEKMSSLGKLSASVAHELNNPLEGILTYSKLILKKFKQGNYEANEKILLYLELIANESARCGEIVKNLLLFSRTSENKVERNDIISIISRSILLINHHLEINNITLVKDFSSDYIELDCDKEQIHQAIVALLINAIEAIGHDGKIIISVKKSDAKIYLNITDSGHGMTQEQIDRVFEPFYTTKEGVKGLGLGLSIVYGIIKQHKGDIRFKSEINKGTTVEIELPENLTHQSESN